MSNNRKKTKMVAVTEPGILYTMKHFAKDPRAITILHPFDLYEKLVGARRFWTHGGVKIKLPIPVYEGGRPLILELEVLDIDGELVAQTAQVPPITARFGRVKYELSCTEEVPSSVGAINGVNQEIAKAATQEAIESGFYTALNPGSIVDE